MENQKSSFRWLVLILLFSNFFLFMFAYGSLPPLFSEIAKQIPLTMAQMGTIMAMGSLAGLLFSLVGGALGDKFGCRWVFGFGFIIASLFYGSRGFMESSVGLYACMFLGSSAATMNFAIFPKVLGMWFPAQELAMANGVVFSSMGVGGAIVMATAARFISPAMGGWRGTMFGIGGVSLALAILWVLLYRDPAAAVATQRKEQNILDNFKKVLKIKDVRLLCISFALQYVAAVSITALLPVIFERRGMARAGELVAIMMGTSVVFNIFGGILSDKVGKRKPFLILGLILAGICTISYATFTGVPLIITLVLSGICMGTFMPVFMATSVEIKQVGMLAGTAVGLIYMIGNIGGIVGPIVSGKLIDKTGSFWYGFIFMALSLILAAFFIIPLQETGRRRGEGVIA